MRRQRGSIMRPGKARRSGWAIKYRDQYGKQHWEGGFDTRGKAQERLNTVLPEVDTGKYIPRQEATFATFATAWLAGRLRVRGSTASGYGSIIKQQLLPRLGKMRVSDIGTEQLQSAIADMTGKLATKSIHNVATLLHTMFAAQKGGSALRLGYIGHDPTIGLELPEHVKREIVPPTKEQAWALIAAAQEIGATQHGATFIGAHTGVRRNELLALRFGDVDWFSKELRIRRAISKTKGTDGAHKWEWREGPPKSKRSVRRIGLTASALSVIGGLKRGHADEDLVFPGSGGGLMDPDMFDAEVWAPIAAKAEMTGTRFHDLRHFFASQLIAQGETPAYVRDQMGHASIQITMDTYGHLFPAARKEATARLETEMQKPVKSSGEPIGSAMVAQTGQKPQ